MSSNRDDDRSSSRSSDSMCSIASHAVKKVTQNVKNVVKKGAAHAAHPFKKARAALSSRASSASVGTANNHVDHNLSHAPTPDDCDEDEEPKDGETDQQELERLQTGWHSAVYSFFEAKVTVGYDDGRKYHFFKCVAKRCKGTKCKGVQRYQDSKDHAATSNLKKHAIKCFGQDAVDAAFENVPPTGRDGSIFSAFARQGQGPVKVSHRAHTTEETRAHIARWCAESNRPLRIVKDRQFKILMKAGRPGTSLPNPVTLSRDIKAAFERCRERIDKILKEHPGLVHFSTDAWTSPNHRAFVAWTVHLHHEGHILVFLLDIVEVRVPESHTGNTLAQEFHKMLINHGLEKKILAFTGDNATSNDKQTEKLDALPNSFEEVNRVRCFNHTMQLSAKALLKPFNTTSTQTDDSDGAGEECGSDSDMPDLQVDDEEEDQDTEGDEDDDEEGDDLLPELNDEQKEELMENTHAVGVTLNKVRKLSFAIVHSTTIALPAWRDACVVHSLRPRLIPRDVKTRWNSTYDMLNVALAYREAVDDITANKSLKLRKYELDEEDWVIVKDLLRVLKMYKDATLFFSQDTVATIAHVIPTMDRIDAMLSETTTQPLTPSVKHALLYAKKIMDKYYSKTDVSNVYRIAMVLHPQLKLKYFQQHGWAQEWVVTAEAIVREEFTKYNVQEIAPTTGEPDANEDVTDFFDIPMSGIQAPDELDEYLSQAIEKVRDPIAWWWDHRKVYPRLSAMALNYLSIPATSTAVERVFSQGRQLLHFTRNRLSPGSIRASLCFGDWSCKDLVRMSDILDAILCKGKRKRAQEEDVSDDEI